ncbi:hypothetical protein [Mycoplasma leonicaptivi]|uniref:hypothetical protein n=1 Tax=Mycoplasma leonicaptivi TaxID=36742 RepID=UPI00048703F6|nr:hypothetical protein [Mycoplasma leonicaptivi]
MKAVKDVQDKKEESITGFRQLLDNNIQNTNGIYTPETYKEYKDIYETIKNKLKNPEKVTKAEITELTKKLKDAESKLVVKTDKVTDAKAEATKLLEKLTEKGDFANRIQSANDSTTISAVLKDINAKLKEQENAKYKEKLDATKKELEGLKNNVLADQFRDEISYANSEKLDILKEEIKKAKEKEASDEQELNRERGKVLELINNVQNQDEKTKLQELANTASNMDELSRVKSRVEMTIDNENKEKELAAKRAEIIAKIDSLTDENEKAKLKELANNAQSIEELNNLQTMTENALNKQNNPDNTNSTDSSKGSVDYFV